MASVGPKGGEDFVHGRGIMGHILPHVVHINRNIPGFLCSESPVQYCFLQRATERGGGLGAGLYFSAHVGW
jgi:hypothetical protein